MTEGQTPTRQMDWTEAFPDIFFVRNMILIIFLLVLEPTMKLRDADRSA